jgi:hypothetical protein
MTNFSRAERAQNFLLDALLDSLLTGRLLLPALVGREEATFAYAQR